VIMLMARPMPARVHVHAAGSKHSKIVMSIGKQHCSQLLCSGCADGRHWKGARSAPACPATLATIGARAANTM
jgi:hypothetical protein